MENSIQESTVQFGGRSIPFHHFNNPLSLKICKEIFEGRTYPQHPVFGEAQVIVDIGANIGAATVFFAANHPRARIFSFEPTPSTFELLARNAASLPQVKSFPFGLSDQDGECLIYQGNQDSVTNSILKSPEASGPGTRIQLRNALEVLQSEKIDRIDILKIDTEGCEVPILQTLRCLLPEVGVVFLEYHSEKDRLILDSLLAPTHTLFSGRITVPHRGELCYVAHRKLAGISGGIEIG